MKSRILIASTIMTILVSMSVYASANFNDNFVDQTMRIDYFRTGDARSETVSLDQVYKYGTWAGSRTHLIDNFNNGRCYAKIYDHATGKLLFSKGFDSFFGEYQTTDKAAKGIKRTYHESVLIPYPKGKVDFVLERRNKKNGFYRIFKTTIDPGDVSIIAREFKDRSVGIFNSHISGDPHANVDIVILGEGYTSSEKGKFKKDLKKFTKIFLNAEPYKSRRNMFNIRGVLKPSVDSGVDEPRAGIFKDTALSATFNSLGSERYLMTEDNKSMRDIAAHVPYDAIYIMANHDRYGGGGIYNLFCVFTANNQWDFYLFTHEFGHSFTGLADEYYMSSVQYNDFYPKGIEPEEPNITRLMNRRNVKWKDQVTAGTKVPTPWEKAGFDKMDLVWQKWRRKQNNKIAELKRNNAPKNEIKQVEDAYNERDRKHQNEIAAYLSKSKFVGQIGAFEGAGYSSKGLYRPMLDCIMFSKGDKKSFCKICNKSITKVIDHYME